MNFSDNQSIYLQITEFVKEQILLNKWQKEEKIPSVRDLAAELQVNPNTVMRAYDFLQQQGVIYNIRGIGNHVSSDAGEKILEARKGKFLKSDLPVIFSNMLLLDIGLDELEHHYKSFVKKIVSNKKNMKKSNIFLIGAFSLALCWSLLIGWFAASAINNYIQGKTLISPVRSISTWKAIKRAFPHLRVNCAFPVKEP